MENKKNKPSLSVLKRSSDFQKIKENGRRYRVRPWLLINFMEQSQGESRFGWTISKKVGSAVVRNRYKRWCREFLRQNCYEQNFSDVSSTDFNFVLLSREKNFFKNLEHSEFDQAISQGISEIKRRLKNKK